MIDRDQILSGETKNQLKANLPLPGKRSFDLTVRCFDATASFLGGIIISPLILIIAICIRICDGGSIFYRQSRMGKNGQPFEIIKFRTMCENAEEIGAGLRIIRDDPRITPVGKILRDFHLDELPQLINVIKGDMSLVGPRPALVFQKDYYEDWEMQRLAVRPGITGLSQVIGGNKLNWDDRIVIDVFYVRNRTLTFYLKVLLLTIAKVFKRSGVYTSAGEVKGWTRPVPAANMVDKEMRN